MAFLLGTKQSADPAQGLERRRKEVAVRAQFPWGYPCRCTQESPPWPLSVRFAFNRRAPCEVGTGNEQRAIRENRPDQSSRCQVRRRASAEAPPGCSQSSSRGPLTTRSGCTQEEPGPGKCGPGALLPSCFLKNICSSQRFFL